MVSFNEEAAAALVIKRVVKQVTRERGMIELEQRVYLQMEGVVGCQPLSSAAVKVFYTCVAPCVNINSESTAALAT